MAEFHSGYMLYSHCCSSVPFEKLQNNYNFDAEMIILAHLIGMECAQIYSNALRRRGFEP